MTTNFFYPSLLLYLDPGLVKIRIRDRHPGSATPLILADDCLEDAVKKVGQEAGWSDEELNQMVLHEVSYSTLLHLPPPPNRESGKWRAKQRLFPRKSKNFQYRIWLSFSPGVSGSRMIFSRIRIRILLKVSDPTGSGSTLLLKSRIWSNYSGSRTPAVLKNVVWCTGCAW